MKSVVKPSGEAGSLLARLRRVMADPDALARVRAALPPDLAPDFSERVIEVAEQAFAVRERYAATRPLLYYQPLPHVAGIHTNDTSRHIVIRGGNRMSKTTPCLWDVASMLLGCHPHKTLGLAPPPPAGEFRVRVPADAVLGVIVCTDVQKLKDVIERKLCVDSELLQRPGAGPRPPGGFLPPATIVSWHERPPEIRVEGHGKLVLLSSNAQLRTFESMKLNFVYIDEPCDREIFDALRIRLAGSNGQMLISYPPLPTIGTQMDWVDELLLNDDAPYRAETALYTGSMSDNPFITAREVEYILRGLDPYERAAREHGITPRGSPYCFFDRAMLTLRASRLVTAPPPVLYRGRIEAEGYPEREPSLVLRPDPRGELIIYRRRDPGDGDEFGIGADVGSGVPRSDRTAVFAGSPRNREIYARWIGRCAPTFLRLAVLPLFWWLYGRNVTNVEYNGLGIDVNETLADSRLPLGVRLFHHVKKSILNDGKPAQGYGYLMDPVSRVLLIGMIREAHDSVAVPICESEVLDEMQTFIVDPRQGARPEAKRGFKDDCVMGYGQMLAAFQQCELVNLLTPESLVQSVPHIPNAGPSDIPAIFGGAQRTQVIDVIR